MSLTDSKLKKLRLKVRLHVSWFVAAILGEDALTEPERKELAKFKKLPKKDLSLAEKSFYLGRLKSLLKKKEWKDLNWATLLETVETAKLSEIEKLALQHAKLKAAKHIKSFADDIEAAVFDQLQEATSQAVTEASLKAGTQKEVELAVLERKSYKELASTLAEKTNTKYSKKWEQIACTELHYAKTRGVAQAIINKVGPYKYSAGADSNVSIITSADTCADCAHHFKDKSGNPKVYKLSELMQAGTNAEDGVDHSKKNGKHPGWKATLPPLHPDCRCSIKFIPPGYEWRSGKLKLVDREALTKALPGASKEQTAPQPAPTPDVSAAQTVNVQGATIPSMATADVSAAQTVNVQGATIPSMATESSSKQETTPCPFGGGEECKKHGGNGAQSHEQGGEIMRAHQKAINDGAKPIDEEAAAKQQAQQTQEAISWGKQVSDVSTKLDHMQNGEVTSMTRVGEDTANDVFLGTIAGNGRAIIKGADLPQELKDHRDSGNAQCPGFAAVPHGTSADREAYAFSLASSLGLGDIVPATATRLYEGEKKSFQSVAEGTTSLGSADLKDHNHSVVSVMRSFDTKEKQEFFKQELSKVAVMKAIMNDNDGHVGNILIDMDSGKVTSIDHGSIGGNGMLGTRNLIHQQFHSANIDLKVPEDLHKQLKRRSLGDVKKSAEGKNIADWEVGQQFLREKYIAHLQDTEGKLDYAKFKEVSGSGHGTKISPPHHAKGWEPSSDPKLKIHPSDDADTKAIKKKLQVMQSPEFARREAEGTLPHQLFERFAKAWMDKHAGDESSPHHADAKQLQEIGVFMPVKDTARDSKGVREKGLHHKHEESIQAGWPEELLPGKKTAEAKAQKEQPELKQEEQYAPASQKKVENTSDEAVTPVPAHRRRKMNKSLYIENIDRRFLT